MMLTFNNLNIEHKNNICGSKRTQKQKKAKIALFLFLTSNTREQFLPLFKYGSPCKMFCLKRIPFFKIRIQSSHIHHPVYRFLRSEPQPVWPGCCYSNSHMLFEEYR